MSFWRPSGRRTGIILVSTVLLAGLLTSGCVTDWFGSGSGFDSRPLSIQTLPLFNQRTASRLSSRGWKGDWIFRRDRLEILDGELRDIRPDVIALLEVMERKSNPSESDKGILGAGALKNYSWRLKAVADHSDTDEAELIGVAVSSGVELLPESHLKRTLWTMGADGFLAVVPFAYEGEPVHLFVAQMPEQHDGEFLWYTFMEERIKEYVKTQHACAKRVIVAGYLPGDQGSRRFKEFMLTLGLKDASLGFCQIASRCYTATPINDIYMVTEGDQVPSRVDRIYLSEASIVYSSGRNFTENEPNNRYVRPFGMSRLWPVQRFGWITSARLPRCAASEFGELPKRKG